MKASFLVAATIISALFLSGCATNRSTIDIPIAESNQSTKLNGKEIYINSVTDNRTFELKPSNPSTPSLDQSEAQGDLIKLRAIGRKRNSYGMGLGDILLPEGKTVESLIESSLKNQLRNNGYKIISSKDQITNSTYIADIKIHKLWSWMTPGFFALTLSTEISTDIAIKHGNSTDNKEISVHSSDTFQMATESNWAEVMRSAISKYETELNAEFK
jgi:uncharacterized lipoprotein YajG